MKQVFRRSLLLLLLIALLGGGALFFCVRYTALGDRWAAFPANDHDYTDGRLTSGQILDRNGLLLYDAASGDYCDDVSIRRATLHAVGDVDNNIATSVKSAMERRMVGFNPVMGTAGNGHSLHLTLDADLCSAALEELGWRKGTVGVYNYETGEILCMVSTPTFDPADPPQIDEENSAYDGVYLNRFLSAAYTPGSVFKIVTAAAALEKLPDVTERSFTCTGSTPIGDDTITCPYVHGDMNFYDALARSCNSVFAQLAVELGGETLEEYARTGGLLTSRSVSGIETAAGSFDVAESYELGWSGVGQYHDLVNPCGMMTLMGAIAGEGHAAAPRLIHRETGLLSPGISAGEKEAVRIGWKSATCRTLQDMMAYNVETSYGQSNFGDLAICAKSGTAEAGAGLAPHAWFSGFLRDSDHPLAFVVVVENGGGGADTAAPIASRILRMATGEE